MAIPDENEAIVYEQVGDGTSSEETAEEKSLEDWLDHMKADNADVRIGVHRQSEEGHRGKMPYLFSFTPQEYDYYTLNDKLRDSYNGGHFRLRAYRNGRLFINELMIVEAIEKETIEKEFQEKTDNNMLDLFNAMKKQMSESNDRMMQMMMMVMGLDKQNQGRNSTDPNQLMGSMLTNMVQMKELLGIGGDSQFNPMDMMKTAVDLATKLSGDNTEDNSSSVFKSLIETFGGPIAEMVMKQQLKPVIVNQNDTTGNIDANSDQQNTPDQSQLIIMMRQQIQLLINAAQKQSDPGLYVDFIIDNIPDQVLQNFFGNDPYMSLIRIDPRISKFQPWFTEFSNMMKQELTAKTKATDNSQQDGSISANPDISSDHLDMSGVSNDNNDNGIVIDQDK